MSKTKKKASKTKPAKPARAKLTRSGETTPVLRHVTPVQRRRFRDDDVAPRTLTYKFAVDEQCIWHGITLRVEGVSIDQEPLYLDRLRLRIPSRDEVFPGIAFMTDRILKFAAVNTLNAGYEVVIEVIDEPSEVGSEDLPATTGVVMVALWLSARRDVTVVRHEG